MHPIFAYYDIDINPNKFKRKVRLPKLYREDEEALDGMKVDKEGNLFVSAPGGVWILSAEGKLLGKITTPERAANMAWGDEDGKTSHL